MPIDNKNNLIRSSGGPNTLGALRRTPLGLPVNAQLTEDTADIVRHFAAGKGFGSPPAARMIRDLPYIFGVTDGFAFMIHETGLTYRTLLRIDGPPDNPTDRSLFQLVYAVSGVITCVSSVAWVSAIGALGRPTTTASPNLLYCGKLSRDAELRHIFAGAPGVALASNSDGVVVAPGTFEFTHSSRSTTFIDAAGDVSSPTTFTEASRFPVYVDRFGFPGMEGSEFPTGRILSVGASGIMLSTVSTSESLAETQYTLNASGVFGFSRTVQISLAYTRMAHVAQIHASPVNSFDPSGAWQCSADADARIAEERRVVNVLCELMPVNGGWVANLFITGFKVFRTPTSALIRNTESVAVAYTETVEDVFETRAITIQEFPAATSETVRVLDDSMEVNFNHTVTAAGQSSVSVQLQTLLTIIPPSSWSANGWFFTQGARTTI